MVSLEASEYWASLCGLIALIQPIPASVSLSETKKYSAHHATNTLAYAIQKFIPESKRESDQKAAWRELCRIIRHLESGMIRTPRNYRQSGAEKLLKKPPWSGGNGSQLSVSATLVLRKK